MQSRINKQSKSTLKRRLIKVCVWIVLSLLMEGRIQSWIQVQPDEFLTHKKRETTNLSPTKLYILITSVSSSSEKASCSGSLLVVLLSSETNKQSILIISFKYSRSVELKTIPPRNKEERRWVVRTWYTRHQYPQSIFRDRSSLTDTSTSTGVKTRVQPCKWTPRPATWSHTYSQNRQYNHQ